MRPWLTSILRNAFIDRIRRKAVTFEPIEDAAQPDAEAAPRGPMSRSTRSAAALAKIDEHLRLAFDLHYLQGLRYREVAKRLAIADNTVASRLFRARQALRDELARGRAQKHGSGGEMTAAWKPEEIEAFAAGELAEEHHERVLAALAADPKAAAELEQCLQARAAAFEVAGACEARRGARTQARATAGRRWIASRCRSSRRRPRS